MADIDRRDRIAAFRLVGFQALVVVLSSLAGLVFDPYIALSALSGGMAGVAGSAWLAFVAFRPSATRPAKEILVSFYTGEAGRFLIVMVLFIVAFRQMPWLKEAHNALALFTGFMVSQLAVVLVPQFFRRQT